MNAWEDKDLLGMIVFAQSDPQCNLEPLQDRIMEQQYRVGDLMLDIPHSGKAATFFLSLIAYGYDESSEVNWIYIRQRMGISIYYRDWDQIAIPFPEVNQ